MYISLQSHSSAQIFQDWHEMSEVESETLKYNEIKRTFYGILRRKNCTVAYTHQYILTNIN